MIPNSVIDEYHKMILSKVKAKTIVDLITNCWLYTGAITDGYGMVYYLGASTGIHRISAHLYLSMPYHDKQKNALHKPECKNRNCWNPDHLYIGTISDNNIDAKGFVHKNQNMAKTRCSNGHEFTPENTYIHKNGSRRCKQCNKDYYEKNKIKW